ncbi:MAG: AAA family ATPase [Psychrobium sp.]
MNLVSESIRITNVYQLNNNYAAFSAVPLQTGSHRIKSAKRIIHVKTSTKKLQKAPEVGQHWLINGVPEQREVATRNGFKIYETHFLNPEKLECTLPESAETFALFVSKEPSFKGITEDTARNIWQHFQSDVYTHLENDNINAFIDILSPAKIKYLFAGFKKYKNLKHGKWLSEINVPLHIQQRLLKYHDEASINLIKENPYLLRTFGMSFKDTDEIAQSKFDVEQDNNKRLLSAISEALLSNEKSGHTIAQKSDIKKRLKTILNSEKLVTKALDLILEPTSKKICIYDLERNVYQASATYVKEKAIALRFKHLLTVNTLSDLQVKMLNQAFRHALKSVPFKLTLGQARAIYKAIRNPLCVISGGAGTGKTTVLKAVLAAYQVLNIPVHCAALSGRAAKRMHESTGYPSMTIARRLREEPIEPMSEKMVNSGVLVIDEASMIDVRTMFRLINHIHPDTRILFVGDPNQLPPIDFGLVLKDVIDSGVVPVANLDIVKRQKGSTGIPEYSSYVAKGAIPPELSVGNVIFHWVNEDNINNACVELYTEAPTESRITAATYKNEKGGIDILNKLCQQSTNAKSQNLEFEWFGQRAVLPIKLNDPIIFTKNNVEMGIQNGSLGTLVGLASEESEFGEVELDDSGEIIQLNQTLLESIKPAYAMSLHKAQGSQFKRVIVPVNSSRMIDRNWLYTAITRAEQEVHLVGPKSFLEAAIERQGATDKRNTALAYLLSSEMKKVTQ